jgi:hypothetical protein
MIQPAATPIIEPKIIARRTLRLAVSSFDSGLAVDVAPGVAVGVGVTVTTGVTLGADGVFSIDDSWIIPFPKKVIIDKMTNKGIQTT